MRKLFVLCAVGFLVLAGEVSHRPLFVGAECGEGECISFNAPPVLQLCVAFETCDGTTDCVGGTDEVNCTTHECTNGRFKCAEKCINRPLLCDGKRDCDAGEDEQNCEDFDCAPRFKCASNTMCVGEGEVCDGNVNCDDGSDEAGCIECHTFKKRCGDIRSDCLSSVEFCDGKTDCENGFDESDCARSCDANSTTVTRYFPGGVPGDICQFGMGGVYCNETCTACEPPFCRSLYRNHYKLLGFDGTGVPQCVPATVEHLDVRNMKLDNINEELLEVVASNLVYLAFSNVSYDFIDRDLLRPVAGGGKLKFVYLSHMRLDRFSLPNLQNLLELSLLNLDGNHLVDLDTDMLNGSGQIAHISMSHNGIRRVPPELFRDQRFTLKELYLSFNQLSNNLAFVGLVQLVLLDLSHNCIERLPSGMFADLRSLERLYLQGNPLTLGAGDAKPIPFISGVKLNPSLDVFSTNLTCDSVEITDEIRCTLMKRAENDSFSFFSIRLRTKSNGQPVVDRCEDIECPNSTCTAFVGGYTCFHDTCLVDEEACFFQIPGSQCSSGGGTLLSTGSCDGFCRCNKAESSFDCADAVISDLSVLGGICISTSTTVLNLHNITSDEDYFQRLVFKFTTLTEVNILGMNTPQFAGGWSLDAVTSLSLVGANLTEIPRDLIAFRNLKFLTIKSNEIGQIREGAFRNNPYLETLHLQGNGITAVSENAFVGLARLKELNLSENAILSFGERLLRPLTSLKTVDLSKNLARQYPSGMFRFNPNLQEARGDDFTICCHAWSATSGNVTCSPTDSLSSCDRLIADEGFRVLLWIQAFVTALGNLTVVFLRVREYRRVTRTIQQKTAKINIFLVGVLAASDLLMSVYLFILSAADQVYAGQYATHADEWRRSPACVTAGVLAMLSGEASVFMLSLITLTRLLSIVQPFSYLTVNPRIFYVSVAAIWACAVVLAFAPLMGFETLTDYYTTSGTGTCLPTFYTSREESSWVYTLTIIVINILSFVLMVVAYCCLIYMARANNARAKRLKMSKLNNGKSGNNAGHKLNARVAVLVITDMICWIPVCIIALVSIAQNGLSSDFNDRMYPATAILLLPINSAINPVIYTLLTSTSLSQRFKAALDRLTSSDADHSQGRGSGSNGKIPQKKAEPPRRSKPSSFLGEAFAALSLKSNNKASGKLGRSENGPGAGVSGTCTTVLSSDGADTDMKDLNSNAIPLPAK